MREPDVLKRKLPEIPTVGSPLVDFIRMGLENRVIPLSSGQPSPKAFPLDEWAEIAAEAIREGGRRLLYGSNRGIGELREWILDWQRRSGVLPPDAPGEGFLLILGAQYGFDLICQALLRPGEPVAMDAPCYPDSWCTVLRRGGRILPIPLDEGGMDLDALEEALRGGNRPPLLYTIPFYQNPRGSSLVTERHLRLVELAEAYDFLIVLDDPYRFLPLDGPVRAGAELLPRAGFESGRVISMGSASKILAPGLRLGWLAAPPALAGKLAKLQEMSLISLPALDGLIILKYLKRYGLDGQLGKIRSFLRTRRDALAEALGKGAPDGDVRTPSGGCFLRLMLPEGMRATSLARRLALDFGVGTVPEGAFWPPAGGTPPDRFLRLAFSWSDPEELALASERIGRGMERELREGGISCPPA